MFRLRSISPTLDPPARLNLNIESPLEPDSNQDGTQFFDVIYLTID